MAGSCPAGMVVHATRESATAEAANKNRRNARPGRVAISIKCKHDACREWHVKWIKAETTEAK